MQSEGFAAATGDTLALVAVPTAGLVYLASVVPLARTLLRVMLAAALPAARARHGGT